MRALHYTLWRSQANCVAGEIFPTAFFIVTLLLTKNQQRKYHCFSEADTRRAADCLDHLAQSRDLALSSFASVVTVAAPMCPMAVQ
jgi:hypothetical protein